MPWQFQREALACSPRRAVLLQRLLAVLQMDQSVQLERVVGQSMGFIGERNFDPRLGTDLLIVKQMMPIQLQR